MVTMQEPLPTNTYRVATPGIRVRASFILAVPGVLAFTVPPLGFLASLLLPALSARVRSRLWPHTSPVAGHLVAALALTGLWLPALLALASSGRVGLEATAWLVIPLCAPSGAALMIPSALAASTYLIGLAVSLVSKSPWSWVVGAWGAPIAYWVASTWLIDFSCVA